MLTFSPAQFLRERNAVLVHFSTVMTRHPDLLFPDDLVTAMTLRGVPLSFSTILPGDTTPHSGGRGGAEGSIGLLAGLTAETVIHSVSPADSGSSMDGSLGLPPTAENCAASIDQRITSNEWHISDYAPAGIFVLKPIVVRQRQFFPEVGDFITGEAPLSLPDAIKAFPDHRIFSANERTYLELDRSSGTWMAIQYDDMKLL